jgi:hypothetical protein
MNEGGEHIIIQRIKKKKKKKKKKNLISTNGTQNSKFYRDSFNTIKLLFRPSSLHKDKNTDEKRKRRKKTHTHTHNIYTYIQNKSSEKKELHSENVSSQTHLMA